MGREAKVRAATRHASAVMRSRAKAGLSLTDPAAMEAAVPPATAHALGRYRTVKRLVTRALGITPKPCETIHGTRGDSRHPKRAERDAARK